MNKSIKRSLLILFGIILLVFATACGDKETTKKDNNASNNNNTNNENDSEENDFEIIEDKDEATAENPLPIHIAYPWHEEQFNDRFRPIEEKLGNVEIIYHPYTPNNEGLQELFAADIVPDIIVSAADNIEPLEYYDAIYPLDDLVKQEEFDVGRINPALVSLVKGFDAENRLIGLPDGTGMFALYYNKEVFDIFGEAYPNPDKPMTWNEAIELGKKMTHERNGQEYVGLELGPGSQGELALVPLRQFAASMTDAETGEVLITEKPEFARFMAMIEDFYDIPGNRSEETKSSDKFALGTSAMTIHWHNYFDYGWGDQESQQHMDIAPVPVWEGMPETGPYLGTAVMVVTEYSENKVTAFRILAEYLSTENQMEIVGAMASGPAVIDPEVLDHFGSELESYKDRNVKNTFFSTKPAEFESYSHFDRHVPFSLFDFEEAGEDIPTFLRKVKEQADINIEEAKVTD